MSIHSPPLHPLLSLIVTTCGVRTHTPVEDCGAAPSQHFTPVEFSVVIHFPRNHTPSALCPSIVMVVDLSLTRTSFTLAVPRTHQPLYVCRRALIYATDKSTTEKLEAGAAQSAKDDVDENPLAVPSLNIFMLYLVLVRRTGNHGSRR
jgi:hypothetical protein